MNPRGYIKSISYIKPKFNVTRSPTSYVILQDPQIPKPGNGLLFRAFDEPIGIIMYLGLSYPLVGAT